MKKKKEKTLVDEKLLLSTNILIGNVFSENGAFREDWLRQQAGSIVFTDALAVPMDVLCSLMVSVSCPVVVMHSPYSTVVTLYTSLVMLRTIRYR